jgi:small-conductance mechanosensitive channel
MTSLLAIIEPAGGVAADMTGPIHRGLERVFGPGVNEPLVGALSWADLAAALGYVLIVLLANGVIAALLRRQVRKAERHPESKEWRTRFFRALGMPLYALIWIYGIYLATLPMISKLQTAQASNRARLVLDKLLGIGVFAVVFWVFFRFTRVIEARLEQWAAASKSKVDDILVPLLGRSLRVILPVIAIILALPLVGLPAAYTGIITKLSSLLIMGALTWILFQAVAAIEKLVLSRYDITAADNLTARKVYTQVHVISKTLYVVIGIFMVASGLMLFEEVRRFGTSILASAGVVGVIVGFAAQRTIANLFAGFQLAMTQPIRVDDVVIVENEWGRIEEITLTYVVVHIWDDRRLIVPLSYFIEKPFQNWTRTSAQLLGSVFVWADYTMPISTLREEVQRIVEGCKDWDRRFWNLQVTDTTDRAMQLRVLATAADSSKAWDLRCEIREKLLTLLQNQHRQSLPRVRAELDSNPAGRLVQGERLEAR